MANNGKSRSDKDLRNGTNTKVSNKTSKPKGRKNKYKADYTNNTKDEGITARVTMSPKNDYRWYCLNEQLLKDTASFPYGWPLGNTLNLGTYGLSMNDVSLPGVMAINWIPTVGISNDGTAPINVSSINVYTKVRHDNSGHANYDHADYMMYLMAMDSVYAFHAWMRRIYGVMSSYSMTNRFLPTGLVKAMGVDFSDLQGNLSDFRAYINTYAIKAAALAIPNTMSIMQKHYWMSEGIYYDSNQDKPQSYLFNPLGFYKFQISSGDTPHGQLVFEPLFGKTTMHEHSVPNCIGSLDTYLTFKQIRNYGDALLSPIIADEDFGIMSGDTLKSFGNGGVYTLPITKEDYTVGPVYEPEVLDQIQNATLIGKPVISSLTIDQDPTLNKGWIIANPKFVHPYATNSQYSEPPGQNAYLVDRFITFEHGSIEPKHTIEATRLTNIANKMGDDGTFDVPTLGTEVACCANIVYYNKGELTVRPDLYVSMNCDINLKYSSTEGSLQDSTFSSLEVSIMEAYAYGLSQYTALIQSIGVFDRHPAIYLSGYMSIISSIVVGGEPYNADNFLFSPINGVLMDINYYTILSQRDLEELSYAALLSEFDVTVRK